MSTEATPTTEKPATSAVALEVVTGRAHGDGDVLALGGAGRVLPDQTDLERLLRGQDVIVLRPRTGAEPPDVVADMAGRSSQQDGPLEGATLCLPICLT